METKKMPPMVDHLLSCKKCDFQCSKVSNFEKHTATHKHIGNTSGNKSNETLTCEKCDKMYQTRAGLWKHNKSCFGEKPKTGVVPIDIASMTQDNDKFQMLSNLVIEIVKSNTDLQRQCSEFQKQCLEVQLQNHELQKQVLDVCKLNQLGITTINTVHNNTTTTNNHKTTFNMQVFLNEHCKDAMNLKDFIDSMVLSLDDLELVGQKGFVDGISKIIVGNLRKTEIHLRPIHCSDAKREVMYIKENDKWEKEGPNNDNMRKFVQYIERKNIRLIGAYVEEHPDCMEPDSPFNDHYLMLTSKATCATEDHINKVISRIAKEVLIDK